MDPNEARRAVGVAERRLEKAGELLLDAFPGNAELWPTSAYALGHHARAHQRALLHGLTGPAPRAARVHARPIVEARILLDYISQSPTDRVWIWIADGLKEEQKMLREWLQAVLEGHDRTAPQATLDELIVSRTTELAAVEDRARIARQIAGDSETRLRLPSVREQAERTPDLLGLYTKAFRHLSAQVHVSARQFTEERFDEVLARLSDSLPVEDVIAVRALAADAMHSILTLVASALGRHDADAELAAADAAMRA